MTINRSVLRIRILKAITLSLNLFALMTLFDYLSGTSLDEQINQNLAWGFITGFGIEFLTPVVIAFVLKKSGKDVE